MLSAFTMAMGGVQAACLLHHRLLQNKMQSPQSFYDTTPSGRILNRFSRDIYVIDELLAPTILMLFNSLYTSLSILVIIVASTPLFLVVIVPLAVFYGFVQVPGCDVGGALMWAGLGVDGAWCGRGSGLGPLQVWAFDVGGL